TKVERSLGHHQSRRPNKRTNIVFRRVGDLTPRQPKVPEGKTKGDRARRNLAAMRSIAIGSRQHDASLLGRTIRYLCPGGTSETSPSFQRRDRAPALRAFGVPEGRLRLAHRFNGGT